MVMRSPEGVWRRPIAQRIAGLLEQLHALAQQPPVRPEPSDTGGTKGSPNTSSDTLPRNGSSSSSSSGVGLPSAIMSEFWNTEWVRS